MKQPTLKQLRYLCSVADHQHFGNAARACHVSQSTLSAGVVELEESLGTSLVERNNRNVVMTSVGIEVVQRARPILVEIEDLTSFCATQGKPFHGRVRLGVIPTVAPFLLPQLLQTINLKFPEFQLFIREDLSDQLLEGLFKGELDLLLLALPFPSEQVETIALFDDEFYLATPLNHPLHSKKNLLSDDLQGESVLLLEDGHCFRDHALEACKLRDSQISTSYQANSLATIVQMVASGIGITLLPKMAVESGVITNDHLNIRPFDQAGVARQIGLMWRKKTPRRMEFRKLGDLIVDIFPTKELATGQYCVAPPP